MHDKGSVAAVLIDVQIDSPLRDVQRYVIFMLFMWPALLLQSAYIIHIILDYILRQEYFKMT